MGVLFSYTLKRYTKAGVYKAKGFMPVVSSLWTQFDISRLGSYAVGDILSAGAIGIFVGRENIIIISICAIILGKIIAHFSARLDGLFDESKVKQFHFAFVPVLFLVTAGVFIIFSK